MSTRRYKTYLWDQCIAVPRTTKRRKKTLTDEASELDHGENSFDDEELQYGHGGINSNADNTDTSSISSMSSSSPNISYSESMQDTDSFEFDASDELSEDDECSSLPSDISSYSDESSNSEYGPYGHDGDAIGNEDRSGNCWIDGSDELIYDGAKITKSNLFYYFCFSSKNIT